MQDEVTKKTLDRGNIIEQKHKKKEKPHELKFIQHLNNNNHKCHLLCLYRMPSLVIEHYSVFR